MRRFTWSKWCFLSRWKIFWRLCRPKIGEIASVSRSIDEQQSDFMRKPFKKFPGIDVSKPMMLLMVLLMPLLGGCRTYVDSWKRISVPVGKAWHNEKFQQTAFDSNSDGRVDRLRFWVGSGMASEWYDRNYDGWFDEGLRFAYEKERERTSLRVRTPFIPRTGSKGAFRAPN